MQLLRPTYVYMCPTPQNARISVRSRLGPPTFCVSGGCPECHLPGPTILELCQQLECVGTLIPDSANAEGKEQESPRRCAFGFCLVRSTHAGKSESKLHKRYF
eukprot:4293952-Alexandrium_andersonii.AAC.1